MKFEDKCNEIINEKQKRISKMKITKGNIKKMIEYCDGTESNPNMGDCEQCEYQELCAVLGFEDIEGPETLRNAEKVANKLFNKYMKTKKK